MASSILQCGTKHLDLSRPSIMGIVNVTPDSFSDGGDLYDNAQLDLNKTLHVIEYMLAYFSDIIDIFGESTLPGSSVVSTQQYLDRVIPVLEAVVYRFYSLFSFDTSTSEVFT